MIKVALSGISACFHLLWSRRMSWICYRRKEVRGLGYSVKHRVDFRKRGYLHSKLYTPWKKFLRARSALEKFFHGVYSVERTYPLFRKSTPCFTEWPRPPNMILFYIHLLLKNFLSNTIFVVWHLKFWRKRVGLEVISLRNVFNGFKKLVDKFMYIKIKTKIKKQLEFQLSTYTFFKII